MARQKLPIFSHLAALLLRFEAECGDLECSAHPLIRLG
jgi:hypothetical protein